MRDPLHTPEPLLSAACAGLLVQQRPRVPGRAPASSEAVTWTFLGSVDTFWERSSEALSRDHGTCVPGMPKTQWVLLREGVFYGNLGRQVGLWNAGRQVRPTAGDPAQGKAVWGGHMLLLPTESPALGTEPGLPCKPCKHGTVPQDSGCSGVGGAGTHAEQGSSGALAEGRWGNGWRSQGTRPSSGWAARAPSRFDTAAGGRVTQ